MLKTLTDLGFDEVDAQVYVYLAKKGMQKAIDMRKALKLTKQQLYPSIKRLQSKGFVSSTMEHPARFSALSFEKVLDLFIKAKIEETQRLQQNKEAILSNWQNLKLEDSSSAKFTVFEGRKFIYSKIQRMIQETTKQILAITTVPALLQADQRGIFEASSNLLLKNNVQFRFLAELSQQNVHIMKNLLNEMMEAKLNFEGRNPDLGLTLFPQMFVRDEDEALFFVKPRRETSIIEQDDVCLWTDCKPLVKAFAAVFEDLWRNSTDIKEKIEEIDSGEPIPKTFNIPDAEMARKKYDKIVKAASEEIIVMTSSKGLIGLSNDLPRLSDLIDKGVKTKIMAPIVDENLEAAKHLSSFCSVKHVPPNYVQTIIVDGKHLFQFNKLNPKKKLIDSPLQFKNTFYTTNPEYVQKNLALLQEIWRNSNPPSNDNLNSIFGTSVRSQSSWAPGAIRCPGPEGSYQPLPPANPENKGSYAVVEIVDEDPQGRLTEQDVLKEIIKSQKFPPKKQPGIFAVYSSQAIAVIHPPDFFKLSPMLIRVHHIEKQSTLGEEDVLMINLWQETSSGSAYVPVAVFSNSPKAYTIWGKHFEASPAGRNIQLADKDELQVWVHGNTLFAGWTKPIQLEPSEYILPPACILIEGYGSVRTEAYSVIQHKPSGGGRFKAMQNGFNAFVTFMHPSSKYSGPGTDGFLVRDYIMEVTPQFMQGFHPTLETKLIENEKS